MKHFKIDFLRRSVVIIDKESEIPEGYLLSNSCACVWIKDGDVYLGYRPDFNISALIHESVHIVHALMHIIGQEPSKENDEFEAYLTEYVFTQAHEIIFAKPKTNKGSE